MSETRNVLDLRASIQRTRDHLDKFERKYDVSTERFFVEMTADEMDGGDLEYVEWAGEAKLLRGLEAELNELDPLAGYRRKGQ